MKRSDKGAARTEAATKKWLEDSPVPSDLAIQSQGKQRFRHNTFRDKHVFQIKRRDSFGKLLEKSIPASGVITVQQISKFCLKIIGNITSLV